MTTKRIYSRRRFFIGSLIIVGGIILLGVLLWGTASTIQHALNGTGRAIDRTAFFKRSFPEVDTASLNDTQKKIIELLKTEYDTQPIGTKYTEGEQLPWCADFASWIHKEAGVPLVSASNGSWRRETIPALKEYFISVDRFVKPGSGYAPTVGDIVLYDFPSPFGNHTNIVIKNENGVLTTIGGNEGDRVRIQVHNAEEDTGFLGYGKLEI